MDYPFVAGTYPTPADGLRAVTTLNNGGRMPWLGLGVFQVPDDADAERAVTGTLTRPRSTATNAAWAKPCASAVCPVTNSS
jgi:hypothetical protein